MSYTVGDYSPVDVCFAYKKSADPTWTYTSWVSKAAPGTHAQPLTGLDSDTQYDFKAQLKYDSTVIEGDTLQFTTGTPPPVEPPLPRPEKPRPSPPMPTPPRYLRPAQLSVQYLRVSPQQASAGQPVTISTNVVNSGDEAGNYNVVLKINGNVEQTKAVSVGSQVAQPVKFTVTKSEPGTYTVAIDGQQSSFTIPGDTAPQASASGGLIALIVMAVLILATAVVLVMSFRRAA